MSRERSGDLGGVSTPTRRPSEPPPGVAARLAALRASYAPETVTAAAERLARERPGSEEPFEVAVARRLRELRSLLDLADYLHRVAPES